MSEERGLDHFDLKELSKKIKLLPPLPHVAAKAMELLTQEEPDLEGVIDIIRIDQGLSMKVLSYVNSAYVGLPIPITDIKKAVLFMGAQSIRELLLKTVISDAIFRVFDSQMKEIQKHLFRHSLATAVVAEQIAKMLSLPYRLEAFIGGLLHDIGKLVLLVCFPEKYQEIYNTVKNPAQAVQFRVAENMLMGINHNISAKVLMEAWKIPKAYISIAEVHHYTDRELKELTLPLGHEIVNVVQIANAIAHNILGDIPDSFLISDTIGRLSVRLGINRFRLKGLSNSIISSLDSVTKLVSLAESAETLYLNSLKNSVGYLKSLRRVKGLDVLPDYLKELVESEKGIETLLEKILLGIISKYGQRDLILFILEYKQNLLHILKARPGLEDYTRISLDIFLKDVPSEPLMEPLYRAIIDLNQDIDPKGFRRDGGIALWFEPIREKESFIGLIMKESDLGPHYEEIEKYLALGKEIYDLVSQLG
ncbi:MAG: HDOD domain-containing protein [Desulfatiglandales bacterium]